MSLVFHLMVLLLLMSSPRWAFFPKPIPVRTAEELIRDKELTYLDLPHDQQKVDKAPNTDRVSDKNRIATRRPTLDRKTLEQIRDSARPGAPGNPGTSGLPPQPMTPPAQTAHNQPGPQAAFAPDSQTQARLEPPPMAAKSAFSGAMTPGAAIQQAARAAAATRVGGTFGGAGGDYGLGQGRASGQIESNLDILSDTMGVDFGPYLSRVLHDVRVNWYNLIPEVARAPLMKKGKVSIEFAILRNGQVAGMQITTPSGDISLDRAALGGISGSNPFPPLPGEFRGSYLALRFHFFYNPAKSDLE
jgi:TonB family protein